MRRLAVLGQPISHSRSPAMNTAALAELGLAGEWSYESIEVAPAEFEARVREMAAGDFVGANVTVPHKVAALELAGDASDAARAIGAANTLSFAAARIAAENTDAAGFLAALATPPAGKRALVLGAGGSARAVVWALVTHGAEVTIWNRTQPRAEGLAQEFGAEALEPTSDSSQASADSFDLIVNATTVGMGTSRGSAADLKSLPIGADSLSETHQLVDLAYGPAETELARTARAHGATVIDGLEVLVRQGAASLRIWTGLEPPIEAMRRAARVAWESSSVPDI
ncbi:MAG: shikimate dehydrogenase [Actinobacteria bacterium 13_1_20CM_3_68_9]|nr:MAG: shikimate dehydrogenase [Actinobacteria bacterium 13_1_20CM_3_68_9]